MFDFISNKFSSIFSRLSKSSTLTEQNVNESLEQIKDALLEADVPYDLVQTFTDSIKKEVIGQKVVGSLKPGEQLAKVVHDKLVEFLGGQQAAGFTFQLPSVVMVMGLQGSGKTTTIAKLAQLIKQEAQKKRKTRRILLASVDFYRPAAVDQLEQLAKQINVSFYRAQSTDPVAAAQEIATHCKQERYELLFLDTAGRLHVDNTMLQELRDIDVRVNPRHKLLVLDAMTGQESLNVAKAFEQNVGFQGAILTKMDSDTRGGAAFSFRYALKKPIFFVGTGEKAEDLDRFHPERAAGRMLGMGDLQSLVEKANEKIKQSEQERMQQSFASGKLTLQDFAQQMDMMGKIGSLSQIMKYMPGMGGLKVSEQELEQGEREICRFKAIINSMTSKERIWPRILDNSRKKRIARGAGASVGEVDKLLKRFDQAQHYAKLIKKGGFLNNMFR